VIDKVGEDDKKIDFEEDEISKLQKDMLKRLDNLKEVDLRQLEGVLYSKKRSRGLNTTDENLNYVTGIHHNSFHCLDNYQKTIIITAWRQQLTQKSEILS
jgi:hypothetical protein